MFFVGCLVVFEGFKWLYGAGGLGEGLFWGETERLRLPLGLLIISFCLLKMICEICRSYLKALYLFCFLYV